MAETLRPFVYWGQKNDHVSLKVEIRDAADEEVVLDEDSLRFSTNGYGVGGHNQYEFEVEFYLPIDPNLSKYRITASSIEFFLKKKGEGEIWPRLTYKQLRQAWLKIDFDKFAYSDESEEDTEEKEIAENELMKQIEKDLMEEKVKVAPDFKISYLFLYNMFQFIGYMYIGIFLQYRYYREGSEAKNNGFEAVGMQMMLCQIVSSLEVIHPLLGLVKTGVFESLAQVMGRNFIIFLIILPEPRIQALPAVYYLFLVYSAIEIIRYPYYAFNSLGIKFDVLTWLRYTAWIPLYPLGIMLEVTIYILSIPLFEQTGTFSLSLPNSANIALYFPWTIKACILMVCSGGWYMLRHMYLQRRKQLQNMNKSDKKKTQ